ncbi:hypothetical protein GM418_20730 [Maribellus comscasis]|uniref:DUF4402 domain-containing protein n=1 Tax=Maribellus comscasis TaxID=2681766 RepID=A0A6I6K0D9_9BACT|nr:hypothetical protein [Maribellus comscasis]QGY46007.1 hypothetical protein GM418_20730 [Maribellus comscasis]
MHIIIRLKNTFVLTIVFLFIMLGFGKVGAQVRATGHVFAEIVEPAMLTASTSNDHIIYNNVNTTSSDLILAEIAVSGSADTDVGVSVQTTALEGKNGEIYSFDTFFCPDSDQSANGNTTEADKRVFKLNGTPQKDIVSEKNNMFTGQYEVTFMYN